MGCAKGASGLERLSGGWHGSGAETHTFAGTVARVFRFSLSAGLRDPERPPGRPPLYMQGAIRMGGSCAVWRAPPRRGAMEPVRTVAGLTKPMETNAKVSITRLDRGHAHGDAAHVDGAERVHGSCRTRTKQVPGC